MGSLHSYHEYTPTASSVQPKSRKPYPYLWPYHLHQLTPRIELSLIHPVGPIWSGGQNKEADLLRSCYQNSLQLATKHHLKTIAFPNIITGVYGYPKKEAAEIALRTIKESSMDKIDTVYFVCFDQENYRLYLIH